MSTSSVSSVAAESGAALRAQLHEERTRREQAEQQLAALRLEVTTAQTTAQHHQSWLTALAQNLRIALMLVDQEGHIVLLNRRFCELFGLADDPASFVGMRGLEIATLSQHRFADPAAYLAQAAAARTAGRTKLNEEAFLADGRVLERDYIVLDDSMAGRLVCYRDVTVRYRRNARTNTISLLAQQSPNPILRLTLEGEVMYANPAAYHLAQAYQQDAPNELRAHLLHLVKVALRTATHHQREITVADQHYVLIVAPVPGEQYASLYLTNITERHQAEELQRVSELVVREQQEFISQIVETVPNLLYVNDEQGEVTFANRAFEEILRRSNHQCVSLDADAPEAAEMLLLYTLNQRVLNSRREQMTEMPFTLANGEVLQYQVVKRPLKLPDGTMQVLTVGTDMTEIKHIRHRLERNAKQYRDLMQYTQALICTHDLTGVVLSANPALAALMGTTIKQMVGSTIQQGLEGEAAAEIPAYLADFDHQREVSGIVRMRPLGSTHPRYLLYHNCLVAEAGEQRYVIAYGQDITERILAEKQLRRAKLEAEASARARENFLANMSHEIRTPLNGVLGMANLLARTSLTAQQREYLDVIRNSGQHLLGVLNDVLDVAKITSGRMELERTCFDLCHTLRMAAQTVAFRAEEKGLDFRVETLPRAEQLVLSDPCRLSQVLLNLLTNSLKFTKRGSITLVCQLRGETASTVTISFRVTDTGLGVPLDKQETIFASFSQAYADTTRRYGGTGLGLTISSSIVEQLGGYLSMCSEPGQGSTFGFTLTFKKAPQGTVLTQKTTLDPDPDVAAAVRGQRVLLVEDHTVNRQLVELVLANYEVTVDAAADGPSALHLFDQNSYNIVLMDIQMPGMSGLEVTARIRQHPDPMRAGTPIIALTANSVQGDNEKYLAAGMDDYLTKPFEEAVLLRKMAVLLQPAKKAAPSLFDLSGLYEMAHGQTSFVHSIVDSFLANTPPVVSQIVAAAAAADWVQAGALAHKIKPSLKLLGAHKALGLIQLLEEKTNPLTERTRAVQQLTEVLPHLLHEFSQWQQATHT